MINKFFTKSKMFYEIQLIYKILKKLKQNLNIVQNYYTFINS